MNGWCHLAGSAILKYKDLGSERAVVSLAHALRFLCTRSRLHVACMQQQDSCVQAGASTRAEMRPEACAHVPHAPSFQQSHQPFLRQEGQRQEWFIGREASRQYSTAGDRAHPDQVSDNGRRHAGKKTLPTWLHIMKRKRWEKKQDDAEAESLRKVQRAGVTAAPAAVAAAARAVYKDPWGPQGSYRAAARHQNSGVFPMEAREVTAMISGCRSLPELADLLGPAPQDPTSTNTDASTRRTPPSHASHHGQEGLHEDATQRMGMRARAARLALRQPLTPIPLTAAATTLARLIQDAPRHLPKHAAARQDDAHAVECIVGRLCWDLGRYSDTGSLALRDRVSQRLQRHAHDARGVASVIRALGITRQPIPPLAWAKLAGALLGPSLPIPADLGAEGEDGFDGSMYRPDSSGYTSHGDESQAESDIEDSSNSERRSNSTTSSGSGVPRGLELGSEEGAGSRRTSTPGPSSKEGAGSMASKHYEWEQQWVGSQGGQGRGGGLLVQLSPQQLADVAVGIARLGDAPEQLWWALSHTAAMRAAQGEQLGAGQAVSLLWALSKAPPGWVPQRAVGSLAGTLFEAVPGMELKALAVAATSLCALHYVPPPRLCDAFAARATQLLGSGEGERGGKKQSSSGSSSRGEVGEGESAASPLAGITHLGSAHAVNARDVALLRRAFIEWGVRGRALWKGLKSYA